MVTAHNSRLAFPVTGKPNRPAKTPNGQNSRGSRRAAHLSGPLVKGTLAMEISTMSATMSATEVVPWDAPGYTAVRDLGSGGFGDVMLARHDASGTLVAIKYLRHELLEDPGFAGMFRAEAAVLAALADPNVVRLYEYIESPGGAAIVMELVDGVSLREILSRQGKTTAEAALVV